MIKLLKVIIYQKFYMLTTNESTSDSPIACTLAGSRNGKVFCDTTKPRQHQVERQRLYTYTSSWWATLEMGSSRHGVEEGGVELDGGREEWDGPRLRGWADLGREGVRFAVTVWTISNSLPGLIRPTWTSPAWQLIHDDPFQLLGFTQGQENNCPLVLRRSPGAEKLLNHSMGI